MTGNETAPPKAAIIAIAVVLCLCLSGPVLAAEYSWTSGGPYGGNTLSVAVSPNFASDQTVFAGNYGGIFMSTDGGATWTGPATGPNFDSASQVTSLCVSPNYASDHTVFAGVLNSYYYDGYIMKSTDNGSTWTTVKTIPGSSIYPAPIPVWIYSIAISPSYASDQTVFVASAAGVLRTTNGGASWTDVNNGLYSATGTDTVAISPSGNTVYAGTLGGGVYKTTNGGAHWSSVGTLPNNQYVHAVALSPGFASDNTMFAGTLAGVCVSTDGGANWSDMSSGLTSTRVTALVLSPSYVTDHTMFAATEDGLFKKSGSSDWAPLDMGQTNQRVKGLAVSPAYSTDGVVFIGKDDGVFKSSDGGDSWAASNGQIANMPVYALGVSPSYPSDNTILAATWGAGVFKSTDGGSTWAPVNSGLTDFYIYTLALSSAFSSDQTAFAGAEGGHIFKTTDGGADWTEVTNGAAASDIKGIVLSPGYATDGTVFFCSGNDGIKKSTDGGASWTSVNNDLSGYSDYALGISPDFPTDHTVFVAVGNDGVYRSTDAGANWSFSANGLPASRVNVLGVSKTFSSDHTVFAGTEGGGVYRSTDGGVNWNAATSGIGSGYIYGLAVSPDYETTRMVSAGTWVQGVYRTKDGGTGWSEYNSGLGNKNIAGLYDTGQTLFAATEAGVWSAVSTGVDFTPPDTTLTAPAPGALLSSSFIISGTSADSESGVAKVEVSINSGPWTASADISGNGTWSSWSYGFRPSLTGNYTLQSRGTDKVGNVETPKPSITVTVTALGTPELQHNYWSPVLSGGSCTFCHTTAALFLPARFRQDAPVFCHSCHNQTGVGHDSNIAHAQGHSCYTAINPATGKMPTYGNVTAAQKNNQQFSRLMPVNIVTCNTCHNIMSKTEDFYRVWEKTTTTDYRVYKLQNGGWAGMGYQKINVYRDTTLWASSPTYSRDKKNYLVSPSEYTYDETAGTVTFKGAQSGLVYIYVTLDYPYTRAGAQENRQCSDCHTQSTHLGANCLACHQAHNTGNVKDIRQSIRAAGMTTIGVKFLRYTGANSFADGDSTHDGICEVCHTQTKYYRRDGTGFADHSGGYNYDGKACTDCHSHATGFAK